MDCFAHLPLEGRSPRMLLTLVGRNVVSHLAQRQPRRSRPCGTNVAAATTNGSGCRARGWKADLLRARGQNDVGLDGKDGCGSVSRETSAWITLALPRA